MALLAKNLEINRCPHCSISNPNLRKVHSLDTDNHLGNHFRIWYIYVCAKCGGVVIASGYNHNEYVDKIFPQNTQVDDAIPSPARDYLQQAIDSLHAPAGAVMLAASAVDAMLKGKGLREGSLYKRIDMAKDENLITPEMAKWAHEVRLDANDQRHADINAKLPEQDDAKRIIDFALALGQFIFVLPARIQKGLKGN